jgi:hypothetical protein
MMEDAADETARGPLSHVACPECETVQIVAAPAGEAGRLHARCVRCRRVWPVPAISLPTAASMRCREHRGRSAKWFCERCKQGFCAACIPPRRVQWVELHTSPCCNARCVPLAEVFGIGPLWTRPAAVLRYPFHRKTWPVYVAILVGLHIPVINWLVMLLLAGYLAHVLVTSARGGTYLPEFPDFVSAWDSVFFPIGRLLICGWWAFAPLWLYARWQGHAWSDPVVWLLWAFALLLTPMVLMLGALAPSVFSALNPVNVVRFVAATGKDYAVAVASVLILWAVYLAVRPYLDVAYLGSWIQPGADLYVLFLSFHILGRTAYLTRDRAEWSV